MIDVSVVIVNYKTPGLICDCLRTLHEFTKGVTFEVLVIDNDSGDDSEAQILRAFPDVRWMQMGYNAGFSRASNRGIENARGRYVILLNSDTLLVSDVLTQLVGVMDARPEVAAVTPSQITREGKVHGSIYTAFVHLRRHLFIFPHTPFTLKIMHRLLPEPVFQEPDQVEWMSGACLMTRPEVIAKVGALDESFFMYGEDQEWSYRLGKAGRLLMLRDAFIVHLEYGSQADYQQPDLSHINRFRTQMHVSNLLWLRKQYGVGAYLVVIFHYLTLVPIIFGWKMLVNLRQGKSPFYELDNQRAFAQQLGVVLRFFWPTVFNKKMFYKV
ncbi:MAG: glycosyltransferase family 2 protein [Cytophagales bacterium]|nr:MAG: glycosyltransferase family 2 protein [Cytophagales bacterium]